MQNIITGIREDIEVGVDCHTEEIHIDANVIGCDTPTDYTVDIDDNTKSIVITPKSSMCSFTMDKTGDTVGIDITANMLSDDNNFEYDIHVDDIGQLVISPVSEGTEFISLVKEDNLNLVTDVDEPYDDAVSEEEIEFLTNNYSMGNGRISTFFERERDCATKLLKDHYEKVECSEFTTDNGTRWEICYSTPRTSEKLTEETTVIGNEDGDKWVVSYELPKNESLTESEDNTPDSNEITTVVLAADADEALKYAKQYAISQRWSGAEVTGIKRQEE